MSNVSGGKCLLNFYGVSKNLTLNGKPLSSYEHKGGGMMSGYVAKITLDPGEYVIVNDYSMTSNAGRKNNKYKNVSMTVNLREGYSYDMGVYTDERELVDAVVYVEIDKKMGWFVACQVNA